MPIGDELKQKAGPLPVWAWAGIGTVLLGGYLIYRKKQAMAAEANTPTNSSTVIGGPSNLSPAASPMPFSAGDTFVNVTDNGDGNALPPCPPNQIRVGKKCVKYPSTTPKCGKGFALIKGKCTPLQKPNRLPQQTLSPADTMATRPASDSLGPAEQVQLPTIGNDATQTFDLPLGIGVTNA